MPVLIRVATKHKYTCVVLSPSPLAKNSIQTHIKRISFLDVVWAGAFDDESSNWLQENPVDLVIASLPPPNEPLPGAMLTALQQAPNLIITSAFPERLYGSYALTSCAFLYEPFSAAQFQQAIQNFMDTE